jgi:hypothetical protein
MAILYSVLGNRGMVCLIGQGPDFFIAVAAHVEWGHGHTVWGLVSFHSLTLMCRSLLFIIVIIIIIKHAYAGTTE